MEGIAADKAHSLPPAFQGGASSPVRKIPLLTAPIFRHYTILGSEDHSLPLASVLRKGD